MYGYDELRRLPISARSVLWGGPIRCAVSKCYHSAHGTNDISRTWVSFLFFSREETRLHVHVNHAEGEAKFWLDPQIALAQNVGLSAEALRQAQSLIEEYEHDIRTAWQQHFGS